MTSIPCERPPGRVGKVVRKTPGPEPRSSKLKGLGALEDGYNVGKLLTKGRDATWTDVREGD